MIDLLTTKRQGMMVRASSVELTATEALRHMVDILAQGGVVRDVLSAGIYLCDLNGKRSFLLERPPHPQMKTLINMATCYKLMSEDPKTMLMIFISAYLGQPQTRNAFKEADFAMVGTTLTKIAILTGQGIRHEQEVAKLVALPLDELVVVTELSLETGKPFMDIAQTLKLI